MPQAQTDDYDQKKLSERKIIVIIISGSATYFLKVGAHFSLKLTIKACFIVKKTLKI